MSEQRRTRPDRSLDALTRGGALACCGLGTFLALSTLAVAALPVAAQEAASRDGEVTPRVRVTTEGVYASFAPRAYVELSRPAYLAVFEVEPGVGALRLYPAGSEVSTRLDAGSHTFRLNSIRVVTLRQRFVDHLGHRLRIRVGHFPDAYLVAVASERPFRLDGLASRRIFDYRDAAGSAGIRASAGEVAGALLGEIVPDPGAGGWDYDLHAYSKYRSSDPFNCQVAFGARPGFAHGRLRFASGGWSGLYGFYPYDAYGRYGSPAWGYRQRSVAISPVSDGACSTSAYVYDRLVFGFPTILGSPFFGPFPRVPVPADTAGEEPGQMDPTGITVGEPQPQPATRSVAARSSRGAIVDEAAVDASLLQRIADARADGRLTYEEVRGLVRSGRVDLPRTLPETMRVEAFRRERAAERADRIRRAERLERRQGVADARRRAWSRSGRARPASGDRSRSRPAERDDPGAGSRGGSTAGSPSAAPRRPVPVRRPPTGGDRPRRDPDGG